MTNTETLRVELDKRSYDILIGDGLLAQAGKHIASVAPNSKFFIITDATVAKLHLQALLDSLDEHDLPYHDPIILEAGEQTKCFAVLERLTEAVFMGQPERKSTLIALGGGVIGDITGFAASIILRGVDFIQIPTTLLAQVDSSVGGKTGINNRFGKNLVGSFYQPKLVLADISLLSTLPEREFLAGYAEVVKYGIISDRGFFDWLHRNAKKLKAFDSEALTYAVRKSCQAKADIVSADERESGIRALLNFGHTFGHALEKETGYSDTLLHGESVSIGMVFACHLSHRLGHCTESVIHDVTTHLHEMGLPTSPLDIQRKWSAKALVDAMGQDKKVSDGKLVFILIKALGETFIEKGVERQVVLDTVKTVITSR